MSNNLGSQTETEVFTAIWVLRQKHRSYRAVDLSEEEAKLEVKKSNWRSKILEIMLESRTRQFGKHLRKKGSLYTHAEVLTITHRALLGWQT